MEKKTKSGKKTKVKEVQEKPKSPKKEKTASAQVAVKVPKEAYYGTGKRKSAIAKVWLFGGKGSFFINNVDIKDYLKSDILKENVISPLKALSLDKKYDCKIFVIGGGLVGQADACRLGIARALLKLNIEFRSTLKKETFLTRDPRVKERKKYGRKKARKRPQYRKR